MKYVGTGMPYSTITSAIAASAGGGELIIILPGTYNETVVINKWVNLIGNTATPENGDIAISGGTALSLSVTYTPAALESIYIEGIEFFKGTGGESRTVRITSSNDNLSIYFNRCTFLSNTTSSYPIAVNRQYIKKLTIKNCYIKRGYSHLLYCYWSRITEGIITKVQLNNAYYCYLCDSAPDTLDVVTTATPEYGPAYGTYYNSLYVGCFSGYTLEQQAPVSRKLYLYDRPTGALITTTTSSGDGYYYMETSFSGSHNIVCLDDVAGVKYNDIISGNVFPTTISG